MFKKIAFAIAIIALSGCAQQTFTLQDHSPEEPAADNMQLFFIHGIGQEQKINAAKECGGSDKVLAIEAQESGLDVLIGFFSSNIISPRHARVYCTAED